jgi:hypothetical protein
MNLPETPVLLASVSKPLGLFIAAASLLVGCAFSDGIHLTPALGGVLVQAAFLAASLCRYST